MGLANAERTLGYIRILTEFISQPEYVDLIPIFGMVNEALLGTIGRDNLTSLLVNNYPLRATLIILIPQLSPSVQHCAVHYWYWTG